MAEPVERWSRGKKTLRYDVELEGAYVQASFNTFTGRRTATYQVDRVEVTTHWELGLEEEGKTLVRLECQEVLDGVLTGQGALLYPQDLDEVPPWLVSLETRASPRDVG